MQTSLFIKKETIRFGQISIDVMQEATDTNGSVAMFELTVPSGERVPACWGLPISKKLLLS